ncbi:MAG: TOBE domain-containing protein, partial [Rhodobacteraceae bacterium]|nr:TOBE domain-containing protein [Paracoccaceae bacterium]
EKPDCVNAIQGVVNDLGYFGKDSLYKVQLPGGAMIFANSVNARRAGENARVAVWEDKVWLSFEPSSAILLSN